MGECALWMTPPQMDDLKHYAVQLDIPISAKKSEAGRGCFGAVFQSKINGAPCIVKKLHDILTGVGGNEYVAHAQWKDIADKFQAEIRLLSQQRHPNIVQFLGVCGLDGDPRDICLVMEQMDTDLDHFIKANKGGIPLELKLRILTDTASGVSHLHANGIVHRDLNSGNVLLSSSLQAKVADLGGSRIIGTQAVGQLSVAPGAMDYMPPEAMRDKPVYGPKLDCFSFGHLSLYFALEVYPRPCEPSIDIVTLGEGLQFQKRRQWFEQLGSEHPLYEISVICLEDIPELRWGMDKIIDELRRISKNHSEDLPNLIDLIKENKQQRKVIDELKKQGKDLLEKMSTLQDEVNEKAQLMAHIKNEFDESKNKIQQQQKEIDEMMSHRLDIEGTKLDITSMQTELSKKEAEMQELRDNLKKEGKNHKQLEERSKELESLLDAANEQLKKLTTDSSESAFVIKTKQTEIEQKDRDLSTLQQTVLSLENELEIQKSQHEKCAATILQLQSENTKLEELTPEDLRKSYRENEDIRKNFEEERVSMDQERRAYIRQIDDLRRQLKEKQEKLQESLDKKTKKEETIHDLQVKLASELKNKDHLQGGVNKLQQDLKEANRKCQTVIEENTKMRDANMKLHHRLRELCDSNTRLEQQLRNERYRIQTPELVTSQEENMGKVQQPFFHNLGSNRPQFYSDHAVRHQQVLVENPRIFQHQVEQQRLYNLEEQTKRDQMAADLALRELDAAKLQRDHYRQPYNNEGEVLLQFDPNLVCPKCGKRFRIGENQTFRRHVIEFCR